MDVKKTRVNDDEVEDEELEGDDDEDDIPFPPPPGMLDPAAIDWSLVRPFVIEDRTLLPAAVRGSFVYFERNVLTSDPMPSKFTWLWKDPRRKKSLIQGVAAVGGDIAERVAWYCP
jgi:hypothetical protein